MWAILQNMITDLIICDYVKKTLIPKDGISLSLVSVAVSVEAYATDFNPKRHSPMYQ